MPLAISPSLQRNRVIRQRGLRAQVSAAAANGWAAKQRATAWRRCRVDPPPSRPAPAPPPASAAPSVTATAAHGAQSLTVGNAWHARAASAVAARPVHGAQRPPSPDSASTHGLRAAAVHLSTRSCVMWAARARRRRLPPAAVTGFPPDETARENLIFAILHEVPCSYRNLQNRMNQWSKPILLNTLLFL